MMIHFKGGVKFSKILVIKRGKLTDLDFVWGGEGGGAEFFK